VPYLGIGARVEFGSNSDRGAGTVSYPSPSNNCNECDNCGTATATVWGIWIRGGLSFN
jgi:hypothetical protein